MAVALVNVAVAGAQDALAEAVADAVTVGDAVGDDGGVTDAVAVAVAVAVGVGDVPAGTRSRGTACSAPVDAIH
jgi:hypothetical protein